MTFPETDSKVAAELLCSGHHVAGAKWLIMAGYRDLLSRDCRVGISHIYKEGNTVMDWNANYVIPLPIGCNYLSSPTLYLFNILRADAGGTSFLAWFAEVELIFYFDF